MAQVALGVRTWRWYQVRINVAVAVEEKGEKAATKFDGECRYCQKKRHKKSDCRKMRSDMAAGKCDKSGKPIRVNALSAAGATQPSPQASCAPSMASTIPLQQMVPVYFPCPDGSQTSQPTETWYINVIVPAQKTHMVASLDGAEYALLDSGSGLTSCPTNYANDIASSPSSPPRPANLPILRDVFHFSHLSFLSFSHFFHFFHLFIFSFFSFFHFFIFSFFHFFHFLFFF